MGKASKLLKELGELYIGNVKSFISKIEDVEVFENPSSREIKDLDTIRFTALNTEKKVYVWDGTKAFHTDVSVMLSLKDLYSNPNFFRGQAIKKDNKFVLASSDFFSDFKKGKLSSKDEEFLKSFFSKDWTWLNRYVNVSDWLEKFKINIGI